MLTQGRLLIIIAFAALLAASAPVVSFANDQPATTTLVNLDLKDTPVKNAIDAIFQGTNLQYIVDSGVSGNVAELQLKDLSVDQALHVLSDAAHLTIRIENGAYIISPGDEALLGASGQRPFSGSFEDALGYDQQPVNGDALVSPAFWGPPDIQMAPIGVGIHTINPNGYGVSPIYPDEDTSVLGDHSSIQGTMPPYYSAPGWFYQPAGPVESPLEGMSARPHSYQSGPFGFILRY